MRGHKMLLGGVVLSLVLAVVSLMQLRKPAVAQTTAEMQDIAALKSSISGFLGTWLVQRKSYEATSYFGSMTTRTAILPRAVASSLPGGEKLLETAVIQMDTARKGYSEFLEKHHPPFSVSTPLAEALAVNEDLLSMLREGVRVEFINNVDKDKYFIFKANHQIVEQFDGGFGDIAGVLQPDKSPTYTLLVDFRDRSFKHYDGPFVAFWAVEKGAWKISNNFKYK